MTSLDYERLLCATGPYEGEIRRGTDRKHPHKIAWIHCVGSRQVIPGGRSYCSAVCCTYTQKQVILTKDHDADAECTIFHNDIRSYGKDFERFYQRAEKLPGIRFIRSYVSIGKEIPGSKNVTIRYSTPDEGVKEEEFDMVVLSVGLNPPKDFKNLAAKFGIELNAHGFCKTNPVQSHGNHASRNLHQRRLSGPDRHSRIGHERQRRRLSMRRAAGLPARKAGEGKSVSAEKEMSRKKSPGLVSMCVIAERILGEWWMSPPP